MKTKAVAVEPWIPPSPDRVYRVRGYHTGEFIGRVESSDRQVAVMTVLDPLRPQPKVSGAHCPFPQRAGAEDHDGDHFFPAVCAGRRIEIPWRLAQFEPQYVAETAPPPEKSAKVLEFGRSHTERPEPRGAA